MIAPQAFTVRMELRRISDGALVNATTPEIAMRKARGSITLLDFTQVDVGTYEASGIFDTPGEWHLRGRSTTASDLVRPVVEVLHVASDGF